MKDPGSRRKDPWFREEFLRRRGVLLLFVLAFLFLLPGTGELPLIDRDEPRFATATREMLERADPVIPWFNGDYRFDKPPLVYWMMMPGYWLFGASEFAARLPAVFSSALAALGIFFFGTRVYSARSGFFAAVAFLTCFQMQIHGRLALADMPMVAGVIFSFLASRVLLLEDIGKTLRFGCWFWVLWLSLSLGFLAKGPVGPLIWLLSLVFFRLMWRRPLPWRNLRAGWGIVVCLVPIAAWGLPALILTDGEFWRVGMGYHVIDRGLDAFNDRITLPFFYFLTAPLSLFPWFAGLWVVVRRVRRNWKQPETRLLAAWFFSPFLVFSFYATQLPHYVLPGFPAFFLLLFSKPQLPDLQGCVSLWQRWYLGISVAAVLVVGALGITVLLSGSAVRWLGVGICSVAILFAALLIFRAGVARRRSLWCGCGAILLAGGFAVFGFSIRQVHLSVRLAPVFEAAGLESGRREAIAVGFREPSLVFYGDGWFQMFGDQESLASWGVPDETAIVTVLTKEYRADDVISGWFGGGEPGENGAKPGKVRAVRDDLFPKDEWRREVYAGFNPARTSWVEVVVLLPKKSG